jgi:hypothetical protein
MAQGRQSSLHALVLGLAVLAAIPPSALAAEPAAQGDWQARWQYVRTVPRDGGEPNRHPAQLSKAEIRAGLFQVRRDGGDGGEAVEVLTPEERSFYADRLSAALAKAGPGEDVLFATVGMRKGPFGLSEQKLTTARLFVDGAGLNLILGESLADVPNDTGTYTRVDPRLVSFAEGRRTASAHAGAVWSLVAGGPGVSLRRKDWVVIGPAAMATPEPGTTEAQKHVEQEVQTLRDQVREIRERRQDPPPVVVAAPPPAGLAERLRLLDDLKAKGLVNAKEYAAKRKQILDSF